MHSNSGDPPHRRTSASGHHHSTAGVVRGGYAVWIYLEGFWVLLEDSSDEGYEPGDPPDEPGTYEGEVVRKRSVPC